MTSPATLLHALSEAAIFDSTPSVLLVEDHELLAGFLTRALEAFGARVVRAGTVAEGQAALDRQRFDTILTDFELPDGTGAILLDRARAHFPTTRRVISSAAATELELLRMLQDGLAHAMLTKPASLPQVLEAAAISGPAVNAAVARLERAA